MKKYSVLFLLILFASHLTAQPTRRLGMNISDLGPYTSQVALVNVMKQCGEWMPQDPALQNWWIQQVGGQDVVIPQRPDGYPTQVPFIFNGDTLVVHTQIMNNQPAPWYYPAGNYTVIFEGTGSIRIDGDPDNGVEIFTTPNTPHTMAVNNPTNWGLNLIIQQSDSADPIRNIRVILPGYENTYQQQPWNPAFLTTIQPFEALRFMKPLAVEESGIVDWSERTLPEWYHWNSENEDDGIARTGLPYEMMIDLVNREQKDLWLTLPFAVNDSFVSQLATMLHDSVDPSLMIYIEYANEAWNYSYNITRTYMDSMGLLMGLDTNAYAAGVKFHTLRSLEMFEIFLMEFGADTSRLEYVLSNQAYDFPGRIMINSLLDSTINPTGLRPHALAIAPYMAGELIDDIVNANIQCSLTVSQTLDTIEFYLGAWMHEMGDAYQFWADSMGVQLYTYEAGQHMARAFGALPADSCSTLLIEGVNRDSRMEGIFCDYFDYFFDTLGGDLMMSFVMTESYSAWGAFGITESVWQDPQTSPKWRAHNTCGILLNEDEPQRPINEVSIYPNPALDNINVQVPANRSGLRLAIYSIDGKLVRAKNIAAGETRFKVERNGLPSGLHFIRIQSEEGSTSHKIVWSR